MRGVVIQALELALKMRQPVMVHDFNGQRELIEAQYHPAAQQVRLKFDNGEEVNVSPLLFLNVERLG